MLSWPGWFTCSRRLPT